MLRLAEIIDSGSFLAPWLMPKTFTSKRGPFLKNGKPVMRIVANELYSVLSPCQTFILQDLAYVIVFP